MFSFTIAPEGINYLGKHLAKEVKGFYTENYKLFMKEIKKTHTNEWKYILFS